MTCHRCGKFTEVESIFRPFKGVRETWLCSNCYKKWGDLWQKTYGRDTLVTIGGQRNEPIEPEVLWKNFMLNHEKEIVMFT
jgi:hypothetical protein